LVKLSDIPGVGPSTVERLEAKGVLTVEQMSIMDPEELKAILECSLAKAKKLIKGAKDLSKDAIKILDGDALLQERKSKIQRISTGSKDLDTILGGGVPTDALTAWYGQFSTGKTQLCNQLVINMKKQYNRKSAWIETEPQTLVIERLLEISKAQGVDFDPKTDLYVITAKFMDSPVHMFKAYEAIESKIKMGEDIGLIVIDSFNAIFRSTYTGREMLPARSAETGRHIGYLQKLASKYNIAVVMTLQVMGVPDSGSQLGAIKQYGIREVPVGPHVLKHGVNYMVGLQRISANDRTWSAIVADGPVPRGDCVFVIDETGIRDFRSRKGVR